MRRRDFIKGIVGSAAAWPLAARSQTAEKMRRIGMLMNAAADHPEGQPAITVFRQALQQSGWSDDRNIKIDVRWGENDVDRVRRYANELVTLTPGH